MEEHSDGAYLRDKWADHDFKASLNYLRSLKLV